MTQRDSLPDIGDATWAHNRWPTVGLFTGAGIGAALGVVFFVGPLRTILFAAVLGAGGLLAGWLLAAAVYGGRGGSPGGELEPAGKDEQGDAAHQDAAGGDDHPGGVAGSEDDAQPHRQH